MTVSIPGTRTDRQASAASHVKAPVQGVIIAGLAFLAGLAAIVISLAVLLLTVFVGVFFLPASLHLLHGISDKVRRRVATAGGISIGAHHHLDAPADDGVRGHVLRTWTILRDRMAWREFLWATADCCVGFLFAFAPAAFILYGLFGVAVQPFVWAPIDRAGGSNWYLFIHVGSTTGALVAVPLGLAVIVAGFWMAPAALRLHARWTRFWLRPNPRTELQLRVTQLARSRADATDAMATELRRIERDVHDGAQARLVALGMNLGDASELFDTDPERARSLLETARASSGAALQELRDLVRGIHPPVLADRGIADALRALALDCVIDVEVSAQLDGRPAAPIETAVYFAVNELITNAVKHAEASTISVDLTHHNGILRCAVDDDGRGGADISRGTGMLGVQRRLAPFDGTLQVSSPGGGPTRITLEIPCALSSPKTYSSSETGWSEPSPNTATRSSPQSTTDPHSEPR